MIKNIGGDNIKIADIQAKRLEKACEEFEALFYNIIMKTGRQGSYESDFIKKSEGEKTFTEMFDFEVSKAAAKNSSGGIKEMLLSFFKENYSQSEGKKYSLLSENVAKTAKNSLKIMA
ncbi:MAG: rod-binding protein [Deferribacterales bacterium]|nr:rod-binding protein [Deferribacterales bacterium]